ncbi:MAG TPA: HAD family hydrolase [Chthoniobacterales bacterium]
MSKPPEPVVFLFDIDNTLLNNDRVTEDIRHTLVQHYGKEVSVRYWEIFEDLREELGYADYLGALQRYRTTAMHDTRLLRLSNWLVDYPFANRLFPESLDVLEHCRKWGTVAILSDGDAVFQPRKAERSGLFQAVNRNVLIYIHKEEELDHVEQIHPAKHYVMVDDKLRILTAMKKIWGDRLTTVFVKQGHYANEPGIEDKYPPADITIPRIGSLIEHDFTHLADT